MGENGVDAGVRNGTEAGLVNGDGEMFNGDSKHRNKNGYRRKETEEERRLRKELARAERHKKEGRRSETEEERRLRKEKEYEERGRKEGKRMETEEERAIRKEKERKLKEERCRKEGKRMETEEERRIRKEKERAKKGGKRQETEEERRIRKEKERAEKQGKERRKETEEERRIRKERERMEQEAAETNTEEEERKEYEEEPAAEEEQEAESQGECMDDDLEVEVKEEPDASDQEEHAVNRSRSHGSKKRKNYDYQEKSDEEDFKPLVKKRKVKEEPDFKEDVKPNKAASKSKGQKKTKEEPPSTPTKGKKGVKKEQEERPVWRWWEEEKKDNGKKWYFLEHKGPQFAAPYDRLPENVRFYYDGKVMRLSEEAEEVATFYGRMLDHDYTTKEVFNKNFFKEWRKTMTEKEREKIRDLSKCDFTEIDIYYKKLSEERKARSSEEKKAEKLRNEAIQKEYGFCIIDGHKEKIGNFKIEPPALFRGRGEHPKQGMLKKRVLPEDVIINCSKDSKIPEPPKGHRWKEVRHDNTVTWLASWTENVQSQIKYVMLNPSSKLKGEKDMLKYEKARQLKTRIDKIREDYIVDFKAKEMRLRQRAVALYFIDKLALRAGNEKDEDQADTVGCCSLRVEHITLHPMLNGEECVVEFDFLGKDSIRYNNAVAVDKKVFKNVQLFMENKKPGDDLFDRLNTSILNEYLNGLMPGLTAKVFRTYNASITLQQQLEELTCGDDNVTAKMLSYNRANRAVAVLCNHQRSVPKTHDKSMANLQAKIDAKRQAVDQAEKEFKQAKKAYKNGGSDGSKTTLEKRKKAVERMMEQLNKLETTQVDKEENKTIALGTSKLNYLDPRISVAWCKRVGVPVEKVFNKTQREKFMWAIEMAGPDYIF